MTWTAIPGYPHATYDPTTHQGHLVDYYPWDAKRTGSLTQDQWYNGSFSPEILNFKDGRDNDILYWVEAFLSLIDRALRAEGSASAILIPVPSSMPKTDGRYSRIPKPKPSGPNARSRDDRVTLFCSRLTERDTTRLQSIELIERTVYKLEKSARTVEAQLATLQLSQNLSSPQPPTLILVDDIRTQGGTLEACKEILSRGKQASRVVILLSLGLTRAPGDFRDIRS